MAADKVGARDLGHLAFQSRGQTTNGLAVSTLRRQQTLCKAVLKRCDSPWRLRISPSARGLTSDGDRRFGFDVRMVLRGSCRRGLFMLDRLPDHLELTSPCAWSTSSSDTSGTRLRRSKMVLCILWLRARMVRPCARSFQPLPSRPCSRISRCTAPLVHTVPADGWVSARTCVSGRVGRAAAKFGCRACFPTRGGRGCAVLHS